MRSIEEMLTAKSEQKRKERRREKRRGAQRFCFFSTAKSTARLLPDGMTNENLSSFFFAHFASLCPQGEKEKWSPIAFLCLSTDRDEKTAEESSFFCSAAHYFAFEGKFLVDCRLFAWQEKICWRISSCLVWSNRKESLSRVVLCRCRLSLPSLSLLSSLLSSFVEQRRRSDC